MLAAHRAALERLGTGPHVAVDAVASYLAAESDAGRVGAAVDARAAAVLLLGACQMTAFLSAFATGPEADDATRTTPPPSLTPPSTGCSRVHRTCDGLAPRAPHAARGRSRVHAPLRTDRFSAPRTAGASLLATRFPHLRRGPPTCAETAAHSAADARLRWNR